jgi:hypothetical protein
MLHGWLHPCEQTTLQPPMLHGPVQPWLQGEVQPWLQGEVQPWLHGPVQPPMLHGPVQPWLQGWEQPVQPWLHGPLQPWVHPPSLQSVQCPFGTVQPGTHGPGGTAAPCAGKTETINSLILNAILACLSRLGRVWRRAGSVRSLFPPRMEELPLGFDSTHRWQW